MRFVLLGWGWGARMQPLLSDFLQVADKLEKLGFRLSNGKVIIVRDDEL